MDVGRILLATSPSGAFGAPPSCDKGTLTDMVPLVPKMTVAGVWIA
jgi:hypothetical protein